MRVWRKAEPGAWLLVGSAFFGSVPTGFLIVALPIYLDRIGLHPELIGTLFTVSGLASALLLVGFGILADRYGRKPFVVAGYALPVFSYLILALTSSKPLLLAASAIGGIGLASGASGALINAGYNALLSDKAPPEARTALFSVAEMAWTAAILVGALLAGLPSLVQAHFGLSYRGAYHIAFLLMVGLGLLATLIVLPIHEDTSFKLERTHWLPRASGRRIALLSLTMGILGLGLGFIVQLLPLWFHLKFHVGEAFLGPWYALAELLAVGVLTLVTPVSRRIGPVPFVILVQGLAAAVLVLMAFAPGLGLAVALYMTRSILMNASWPVQQAYIMDVVEPSERATASSLTFAAWSVAGALTPPIGGAFLGAGLYALPFLLGGACYALSSSIFYRVFHEVRPVAEPAAGMAAPALGE